MNSPLGCLLYFLFNLYDLRVQIDPKRQCKKLSVIRCDTLTPLFFEQYSKIKNEPFCEIFYQNVIFLILKITQNMREFMGCHNALQSDRKHSFLD